MTALPLPDPIHFALRALEARGALSDRDDQGPYLLLPEEQARTLQAPTELRLSPRPDADGAVFCGLGSALLDQLCQGARGEQLRTSIALDVPPPRPAQAIALAQRLVFRNAVHEVGDAGVLQATYVTLVVNYVAEADDRHEGLLVRTVCASDGAEPDGSLCQKLDPTQWTEETLPPAAQTEDGTRALPWLLPRLSREIERRHLPPLLEALGRRKQRDHERIEAYFAELIGEARSPRRKTDEEAIARKVEHLLAERDTKLRDLDARYGLRVRIQPAALVVALVPALMLKLAVRRRKESREIPVRLPGGASSLDTFRCEGCGEATTRPALCDQKLHLLCEVCVPVAQGRFDCPACRLKHNPAAPP